MTDPAADQTLTGTLSSRILPRGGRWTADRVLRWALAAAALSLAIRLPWASLAHVTPFSDFAGYDRLAWRWLTTGDFGGAYRTPGYPGFLAAIYWVFGHSWRAAQVFQALLGACSTGLVVLLAARIVAPRTALIAGVLHAIWPTSVVYVAVLASENVSVPLVLGTLLALTAEVEPPARRAGMTALAGLLFALLLLVRPAGLYFLPIFAILAVWEPRSARRRLLPGLAFAAAALVAISPWLIRNHQLGFGPTLATTGGVNLWMGNSDAARRGGYKGGFSAAAKAGFPREEKARDDALKAAALRWIRENPGRYLSLCAVRAARMLGMPPDWVAASVLWPTRENDAALVAADPKLRTGKRAKKVPETASQAATAIRERHLDWLRWLRALTVPLVLLAFALCLGRFRTYVIVAAPVLCYAAMLSATYFSERFRELSDPLLLIPLGALVSDIVFGTAELPPAGTRRWLKPALAGIAVALGVTVHLTGWDARFYRL
jgi:4-amino-4-deoxy-L-arabinose transferase-like glycosyltransferase